MHEFKIQATTPPGFEAWDRDVHCQVVHVDVDTNTGHKPLPLPIQNRCHQHLQMKWEILNAGTLLSKILQIKI